MKNIVLTALFITTLFVLPKNAAAQYYFYDDSYGNGFSYEAGVSLNAMNCFTDIGGKKGIGGKFLKDLNIGKTKFAGGLFFGIIYKNAAALRLEGTFGEISANDNVLSGVTDIAKQRFNRNLNFRSNISEASAIVELHPLFIFINWAKRDQKPPRYSPYILGGIGYFSYKPQAEAGNKFIDLQPLHTEGQGFPEYPNRQNYSLSQTNIPLGGGIKYEASPLINLRLEFVYRKLHTDYLDDVSTDYIDPAAFDKNLSASGAINARALYDRQINKITTTGNKRGDPTHNDAYFSLNLKASILLGRNQKE